MDTDPRFSGNNLRERPAEVNLRSRNTSLPGREARAKDPQHPKILGSRTKESPTPPVATSWRRGPTNPESYAPAQLVLEWHRIAEPVGSPREPCREGRRVPRKCLKPPKPQRKETTAFESPNNHRRLIQLSHSRARALGQPRSGKGVPRVAPQRANAGEKKEKLCFIPEMLKVALRVSFYKKKF